MLCPKLVTSLILTLGLIGCLPAQNIVIFDSLGYLFAEATCLSPALPAGGIPLTAWPMVPVLPGQLALLDGGVDVEPLGNLPIPQHIEVAGLQT